jgi:hypothetical protein
MNVHYKMFQVSSMAFTGASARQSLHLLNPPFHYCDPSRVLTWHSSTDFISRLLRGCFLFIENHLLGKLLYHHFKNSDLRRPLLSEPVLCVQFSKMVQGYQITGLHRLEGYPHRLGYHLS